MANISRGTSPALPNLSPCTTQAVKQGHTMVPEEQAHSTTVQVSRTLHHSNLPPGSSKGKGCVIHSTVPCPILGPRGDRNPFASQRTLDNPRDSPSQTVPICAAIRQVAPITIAAMPFPCCKGARSGFPMYLLQLFQLTINLNCYPFPPTRGQHCSAHTNTEHTPKQARFKHGHGP